MNKKTIIVLSALIVLMLGIIAAGVNYLYSSPEPLVSENVSNAAAQASTDASAQAEDLSSEEMIPAEEETPADTQAEQKAAEEAKKAEEARKAEEDRKAEEAKKAEEAQKAAQQKKTGEFQVKNSGTGKMNTLRQNSDNSLELIDHNGARLWKVAFPGKIVGEPAQIDIYNNLKIQFLICEGSKLHLIDRLGREVNAFPLALPSAAKSGPVDVKAANNVVYWKIETEKGLVYFDKKTKTILNQLPN